MRSLSIAIPCFVIAGLFAAGCKSGNETKPAADSTAVQTPAPAAPQPEVREAPPMGTPVKSGISGTYNYSSGSGEVEKTGELKVSQKSEKELKFAIVVSYRGNTGKLSGTMTLSGSDTFYTFTNTDKSVSSPNCGLKAVFHSDQAMLSNTDPNNPCLGGVSMQFDGLYKKMSRDEPTF